MPGVAQRRASTVVATRRKDVNASARCRWRTMESPTPKSPKRCRRRSDLYRRSSPMAWRQNHNEARPHSALEWSTPAEYASRAPAASSSVRITTRSWRTLPEWSDRPRRPAAHPFERCERRSRAAIMRPAAPCSRSSRPLSPVAGRLRPSASSAGAKPPTGRRQWHHWARSGRVAPTRPRERQAPARWLPNDVPGTSIPAINSFPLIPVSVDNRAFEPSARADGFSIRNRHS